MSGPSQVVGIDTQILVFAHKQSFACEEQEQLSNRAKRLMKDLISENCRILISMITVGEYLAGVDETDRPRIGQELMERYLVAPYNLRAAIVASRLTPMVKQLVNNDRQVLFADAKIVGSIAAFPCNVFYTHDLHSKMSKIAQSAIKDVRPLPPQLELPLR
jgi:hypothetical protein